MLTIPPDQVQELPVDELALHVLADMRAMDEWNEYNYTLQYAQPAEWREAAPAVAEAVGWLRGNGFIARQAGNTSADAIFITRLGDWALSVDLSQVRSLLQIQADLHPLFQHHVRRQFLLGEYENAIFTAMRAVEVRVRQLGQLPNGLIGRSLMTEAFKDGGPLRDPDADAGESNSLMMLFSGAYGVLRNPSGHREIAYDDPREAVEAVMTASLLMRILDRVEAWLNRGEQA
jgi:uncharacterized protein (TIGR02391 family)